MQNTSSPTPSASIFEPFQPPVVGGSDGAVSTPPAPRREPKGIITRRAQVQRAFLITKLFLWFVIRAKFGRYMTKDHDAAIRQEAVWLRHITEQLGGTFVKLAQHDFFHGRRQIGPQAARRGRRRVDLGVHDRL